MGNEKRVLDERRRRYVSPARVVCATDTIEFSEHLLDAAATITKFTPGQTPTYIVLDFGQELHGGIRIEGSRQNPHRPVKVRVRFGESISETMGAPNNDHAIHDWTIDVPWFGSVEAGQTGFRFVRIDLVDDAPLVIERILAVALEYDLPYIGSFECSDERINEIWRVSARTVHLCMQDYLWDGIKRDRLAWIGDTHPEAAVVSCLFGEHPIVPRSMDFVRDNTPLPGWMNGISSYSLWWIIIQRDWLRAHGNLDYLREQRAYLLALLNQITACVAESGEETLTVGRFLEWATARDQTAIDAGLQALMVLALDAAADLARALNEPKAAQLAQSTAARARSFAKPPSASKQANALLALAGLADPVTVNANILAPDPCKGLSPFYGYYVLQARALAGDVAGALDLVRAYWGAMLDLGATTFWEHFDMDWLPGAARIDELTQPGQHDVHLEYGDHCYKGLRHSFCHGWSGGPAAWLMEHILGIAPASPGFAAVRITPNLAGLAFARGTYPTPHGPISVEHEADGAGGVRSRITLPEGVTQAIA
ncbi:MAG: alpha-L-rhamnosidase C-terminal domain-containing protein [Capsulimonadaceae bacterium]|nr:alpha-L-rhamnosidase C-terminal domain-containing protein [Capsulimonadaceae bacterium]